VKRKCDKVKIDSHSFSKVDIESFNGKIGVSLSYYGAVLGGIVGGLFTYLGVKMSLDNQEYLAKQESQLHRNMLITQLKFSYDMFYDLDNIADHIKDIDTTFLIFDKEWYTHLTYIKNLSQEDLSIIIGWFYTLHSLEIQSKKSESGGVSVNIAKKYTKGIKEIKSIIEKLENN
jgi:hypothetical protein